MRRRDLLTLGFGAAAALGLMGHSPYRQWHVYRRQRLIIVAAASDDAASVLVDAVAARLATELPETRATVARVRDPVDVAKLLGSGQLDVALVSAADAAAMLGGDGRFGDDRVATLCALAALGSHLLVARADLPADRAREIGRTVASTTGAAIPFHPALGARRETAYETFQTVADKVVGGFSRATEGVRNVRIDIRRRDTAPAADVTIVGVLGMDIKPKDGPAWYSVRLVFGERDGQWSFLTAHHELPSERPAWAPGGDWYRDVVEGALDAAPR